MQNRDFAPAHSLSPVLFVLCALCFVLFLQALAPLVCDSARCFTRRLAGRLTLPAAPAYQAGCKIARIERFDSFHIPIPHLWLHYLTKLAHFCSGVNVLVTSMF